MPALLKLLTSRLAGPVLGSGLLLALIGLAYFGLDARHWHKQSDRYEQLWTGEKVAHQQTEINYRRATEQARQQDLANLARVKAEQAKINQETTDDFESRIAAARAVAERLRQQPVGTAANPGSRGAAPVSGVPAAAGSAVEAAGQDGLPQSDRLTATEQAIQLDELIKWVRAQAALDVNGGK